MSVAAFVSVVVAALCITAVMICLEQRGRGRAAKWMPKIFFGACDGASWAAAVGGLGWLALTGRILDEAYAWTVVGLMAILLMLVTPTDRLWYAGVILVALGIALYAFAGPLGLTSWRG